MAVLSSVHRPQSQTDTFFVQPLSLLVLVCIVVAVMGIKLKWFKHRLVFGQGSSEADDAPSRGYRSLASAEPQIVRAVFRTGLENDDYFDRSAIAAPLPPIRITKSERLFSRPQSLNLIPAQLLSTPTPPTTSTTSPALTPSTSDTFLPVPATIEVPSPPPPPPVPAPETQPVFWSASVDISPDNKENIVFASSEDLRPAQTPEPEHSTVVKYVEWNNNESPAIVVSAETVTSVSEVENIATSVVAAEQPTIATAQSFSSTPDLSTPELQPRSPNLVIAASAPNLATNSPQSDKNGSFLSYLTKRWQRQEKPTPAKRKVKTVRVLKEPKEKKVDAVPKVVIPPANEVVDEAMKPPVPVPRKHLPVKPAAVPVPVLRTEAESELKRSKSPNVVKHVRFVTPEVSDNESEIDESPESSIQPAQRTIQNTATERAEHTLSNEDADPWDILARHRSNTEALDRNRALAAELVVSIKARTSRPTSSEGSEIANRTNIAELREEPSLHRPKTLREMQRAERERRENPAVMLQNADATRLNSDTEA